MLTIKNGPIGACPSSGTPRDHREQVGTESPPSPTRESVGTESSPSQISPSLLRHHPTFCTVPKGLTKIAQAFKPGIGEQISHKSRRDGRTASENAGCQELSYSPLISVSHNADWFGSRIVLVVILTIFCLVLSGCTPAGP